MIDRLAVDTNAWVAWFRDDHPSPEPLTTATNLFLPLPVIGELYAGAYSSLMRETHIASVDDLTSKYDHLVPDRHTARIYGQLRARMQDIRASKMNDLWIAALCLQHSLPLLTNDRGFDSIEGLAVVHW